MCPRPPRSTRTDTLFPYTTRFRSEATLRSVAPAVRFVSSGGWTRTTNQEPRRHEGAWALGCAPLVCRAGGSCRLFRVHPCLRNTLTTARSEEHTSELQSLMRSSYAVFCLKKKNKNSIH